MSTILETKNKIIGFESDPIGWHYQDGFPLDKNVSNVAQKVNEEFGNIGFLQTNAFHGVGGQVQINGYWKDLYAEFILEDSLFYYILENNNEIILEKMNLNIYEVISEIQLLKRFLI